MIKNEERHTTVGRVAFHFRNTEAASESFYSIGASAHRTRAQCKKRSYNGIPQWGGPKREGSDLIGYMKWLFVVHMMSTCNIQHEVEGLH
jgi:hypothetical protein